jgi:hypothetical protein
MDNLKERHSHMRVDSSSSKQYKP